MTSVEQVKQEIIDWANSDEVKDVFNSAGWSESKTFPDACPYLYEYLDASDINADSGVVLPSGNCRKVELTEDGLKFAVVFSVENGSNEKSFYRFTGRSNSYETSWERSILTQVFPKVITKTIFTEDPS